MFYDLAKELHKILPTKDFGVRTISVEVTNEELKQISKDIAEHYNSNVSMIFSGKEIGIENAQFASITTPFIKINFKVI
jgi:hypothetical protein